MKHVITFFKWPPEELRELLGLTGEVKSKPEAFVNSLQDRTLLMLFQKTSTRTRVSFEVAMTELGGHAIYLDWRATNMPITELSYEARFLSSNCSFIVARVLKHADLQVIAENATVPVINGLDDRYHPTQVLSDFFTIIEKLGDVRGKTVAYIGIHNNVANSLLAVGCALGAKLILCTPLFNEPSRDVQLLDWARATGLCEESEDVASAIRHADIVYLDTWVDMEFFGDDRYRDERLKRERIMKPYQVTRELLGDARALIMHDMPIHVGYEVEREVVDDPRSIIFEQAANLRHARKALLVWLAQQSSDDR